MYIFVVHVCVCIYTYVYIYIIIYKHHVCIHHRTCTCVAWRNQLQELQRTPVIDFIVWMGTERYGIVERNRAVLICNPNQFHIHKNQQIAKCDHQQGKHINVYIYCIANILPSKLIAMTWCQNQTSQHEKQCRPSGFVACWSVLTACFSRFWHCMVSICTFLSILGFSSKRMNASLNVPL